ncbi:hypothetical protein L218DRAFT_958831 [Marasmius fiardii PR-910]|nr:hypothetical protein L218DRAFT_958831 [Marasmius fiardii PR-910]
MNAHTAFVKILGGVAHVGRVAIYHRTMKHDLARSRVDDSIQLSSAFWHVGQAMTRTDY